MERIVIGILVIILLAGCTAFGNPYANDIFIIDSNITNDFNGADINALHLWDANTLGCTAVATTPSGEFVCTTITAVGDVNNTDINVSGLWDANLLGCDVVATTPAGELVCDIDAVGSGGGGQVFRAGTNLLLTNVPDINTFHFNEGNWLSTSHDYTADQNFANIGATEFFGNLDFSWVINPPWKTQNFPLVLPWADANVADDITASNYVRIVDWNGSDINASLIYDINLLGCEVVATTPAGELVCTTMVATADVNETDVNFGYVIITNDLNVFQQINTFDLNVGLGIIRVNTITYDINADLNRNAQTACSDDEFFNGDGTCNALAIEHLLIIDNNIDFSPRTKHLLDFFNGVIVETINVDVNSDGTDVNLYLERKGTGDLNIHFSTGFINFDTTPPATVNLTAGSDSSPTLNYIFIPEATKVLSANTTGFPEEEHANVAKVLVQSAASVQIDGLYRVHVYTDHVADINSTDVSAGHLKEINEWVRTQPATWDNGIVTNLDIQSGASPDDIFIDSTSGDVLQLHLHDFPAFDTEVDSNIFVVNDSVADFNKVKNLNDLLLDSTGASMSGRYFTIVLWGNVSENAGDSQLFINLPNGSYFRESDAIADVSGFTVLTIPVDFKGSGFLITAYTLRHQNAAGGTWTLVRESDLRGLFPSTAAAGGSGALVTDFADNAFTIFDESDVTKELVFDVGTLLTTGNTRTITIPDRDLDLNAPVFDTIVDLNLQQADCDVFASAEGGLFCGINGAGGTGQRMITQQEWDDNFLIAWGYSFDGNFSERFQTDFDSNIAATELSELIYDADFNAAFPAGTGQRMITQQEWDDNFLIWWGISFDSNFTVSFDGNILIVYSDLREDIDSNVANLYNCDSNATCIITGDITGAIGFETDSNYITAGHTDDLSSWVYDADFNAAIATLSTGQRMITQQEWDDNFLIQWDLSFDGNFSTRFDDYFDGNWLNNWNVSFDDNWNVRFEKDFDGNFNLRFQTDFDSNIAITNLSQLIYDADFNAAFPTGGGADGSCDNNVSCTLLASTVDDWNGTSSLNSGVIASPPWLTTASDSSCDNNVNCTILASTIDDWNGASSLLSTVISSPPWLTTFVDSSCDNNVSCTITGDITGGIGYETDSNAATDCSGESTFLSGEGICVDTNTLYPTLYTNASIFGEWTFVESLTLPSASPTSDDHAARKKWRAPVIDKNRSTPPDNPDTGQRHIAGPDSNAAWEGQDNNIMDYNGSDWVSEGDLVVGWAVFTTIDSKGYTWSGTDQNWVQFSGGGTLDGGDGIDIDGTTISVDIKSGDGLRIDATELTIDYVNFNLDRAQYTLDYNNSYPSWIDANIIYSKVEDRNNLDSIIYTAIAGEPWIDGGSLAAYFAGANMFLTDLNFFGVDDGNLFSVARSIIADWNITGDLNLVNVTISGTISGIIDGATNLGSEIIRFGTAWLTNLDVSNDATIGNQLSVVGTSNLNDVNIIGDVNLVEGDFNINQGNLILIDSNICGGLPPNDGSDKIIVHFNENYLGSNLEVGTVIGGVGIWHFDEGTGTTAVDSSGISNGTVSAAKTDWVLGKYRSALDFDGVDNNLRLVGANVRLFNSYPFTFCAWINPDLTHSGVIMSVADKDVASRHWGINVTTGDPGNVIGRVFARNTTAFATDGSIQIVADGSTWTHLCGVFASSTSRKLYVNGVFDVEGTDSVAWSTAVDSWDIGRWGDSTPATYFDGKIDEPMVIKGNLTQPEIEFLANNRMFGNLFFEGKLGASSFTFDGVQVRYPTNSNILPTKGNISFWIKTLWDGDDGAVHVLFDTEISSNVNQIQILKTVANNLQVKIEDASGVSALLEVAVTSANFPKDTWHYISASYDEGVPTALYLNGTLVDDVLAGTHSGVLTVGTNMYVGRDATSQANESLAQIDEFITHDKPLTSEEVYCNYLSNLNGYQSVRGER